MRTFDLEEGQRQAVLLAIAKLAVERPGWDWMLGDISERLRGREMFERFKEIHSPPPGPSPEQGEPRSAADSLERLLREAYLLDIMPCPGEDGH